LYRYVKSGYGKGHTLDLRVPDDAAVGRFVCVASHDAHWSALYV
jgi:hypothetical protein